MSFQLGQSACDIITGFRGTITSIQTSLHEVKRYELTQTIDNWDHEDYSVLTDGQWFSEGRVRLVKIKEEPTNIKDNSRPAELKVNFYREGTSIPTCLIKEKSRELEMDVLVISANNRSKIVPSELRSQFLAEEFAKIPKDMNEALYVGLLGGPMMLSQLLSDISGSVTSRFGRFGSSGPGGLQDFINSLESYLKKNK